MRHDHVGEERRRCDRNEVPNGIVGRFRIEARVDRVRARRSHNERVPIRCTTRGHFGAENAARATPVVDHHDLFFPRVIELLSDDTCHYVGSAARRKRYDDANSLGRVWIGGMRRLMYGDACENCGAEHGKHCGARESDGKESYTAVPGDSARLWRYDWR